MVEEILWKEPFPALFLSDSFLFLFPPTLVLSVSPWLAYFLFLIVAISFQLGEIKTIK